LRSGEVIAGLEKELDRMENKADRMYGRNVNRKQVRRNMTLKAKIL
jgi:hypothetical protein